MRIPLLVVLGLCSGCGSPPNNPYPPEKPGQVSLYTSFEERPKHLDPGRAYSANEFEILGAVYEPPLQYGYLKRPPELEPLALAAMPEVDFEDDKGRRLDATARSSEIAYTVYRLTLRPDLRYAPHPAFSKDADGRYLYHHLEPSALARIRTLADFEKKDTRKVTAADFAYAIKRLADPQIHSPIAELMSDSIVGLGALNQELMAALDRKTEDTAWLDLRGFSIAGVEVQDDHHLSIRLKGVYPQFRFWLAMPFFAPVPWEAEVFYAQPGLKALNVTLDWYPVGSGPYQLVENNPNRRMVLVKNPNYHEELYPREGQAADREHGLLKDAGQRLPFIDRVVFTLEKEAIPYWNKFLQGYYDASGISSDQFDQAVQFNAIGNAELTPEMQQKGIQLETAVSASIHYLGFNMLDPVVGGLDIQKRKLRQAISIAVDQEEYISIFMNGRGVPAQGALPPGLFGAKSGREGMNPKIYDWVEGEAVRKPLTEAKALMIEAGYPQGIDPATKKPLVLFMDSTLSGVDDKSLLNWYRKQFAKLGIQLVFRTTDYNQFQQKMSHGNAQIFRWGWNADYPDPENFFFLLYGENAKARTGGENAANYENPAFDRLFRIMRNQPDDPARLKTIAQLQALIQEDAPWVFGVHPIGFTLHHAWYRNLKPHPVANNTLKYLRIDSKDRDEKRMVWNPPILWPLLVGFGLFSLLLLPALRAYRRRLGGKAR